MVAFFTWAYGICLILSVLCFCFLVLQKASEHQQFLSKCLLAETVMLAGYWLRITASDMGQLVSAQKLIFAGGCVLYLMLFRFAVEICGFKLPKFVRIFMTAFALCLMGIMFTFDQHQLVYTSVSFDDTGVVPTLVEKSGVFIYIYRAQFFGYSFLMLLVSLIAIGRHKITKRRMIRTELLVFAALQPAIAFLIEKIGHLTFNILPFACAISIAVITFMVYWKSIYDISDEVREMAYEKVDVAIITVSSDHLYQNCNPLAQEMFPGLCKLAYHEKMDPEEFRVIQEILSGHRNEYFYHGRVYETEIRNITKKNRLAGKVIWFKDATSHVEKVNFMKHYQEELSRLVDSKTAHIIEIQNRVLVAMSDIIEGRDGSTGGHVKRTSYVVKLLTEEMAKQDMYQEYRVIFNHIQTTAPLHDLGKLSVDDQILRKPGKLTDEEYEQMKTHAVKGEQMIQTVLDGIENMDVLRISKNIARHHHERWDGRGYPDHLSGEEIPLEARIMAVADVYDALVSRRCYKEPMSFEQANQIMQESFGSQFDPNLKQYFDICRPAIEQYYAENDR